MTGNITSKKDKKKQNVIPIELFLKVYDIHLFLFFYWQNNVWNVYLMISPNFCGVNELNIIFKGKLLVPEK